MTRRRSARNKISSGVELSDALLGSLRARRDPSRITDLTAAASAKGAAAVFAFAAHIPPAALAEDLTILARWLARPDRPGSFISAKCASLVLPACVCRPAGRLGRPVPRHGPALLLCARNDLPGLCG